MTVSEVPWEVAEEYDRLRVQSPAGTATLMRPQFIADAEGAASIVPEAVLLPLVAVSVQVPVSSVTPVTRPDAYTPSLENP